ncbi:MAG: SDR family oxidoreductase [Thermoanaerobaculia bacterium]
MHPDHERLAATATANTPLGRAGLPDDVADAVLLLCSPLARWITGQIIVADGGMSVGFGR